MDQRKIVGVYIVVAGCLQSVLNVLSLFKSFNWLFYFNPRIGLFAIETSLGRSEGTTAGLLSWLSTILLLVIGSLLISKSISLKVYVIAEAIMSLPSVIFFIFVIGANLSPAHGFSIGELVIPILVFLVFSVLPMCLALRRPMRSGLITLSGGY